MQRDYCDATDKGMLCSGKTTVGKLLAEALQYPFVDVDSLVEQSTETTIAEIFASEGEESFREVETATLKVTSLFSHACAILYTVNLLQGDSMHCLVRLGPLFVSLQCCDVQFSVLVSWR